MSEETFEQNLEGLIASLLPGDYEPVKVQLMPGHNHYLAWLVNHPEHTGFGRNERAALASLLLSVVSAE